MADDEGVMMDRVRAHFASLRRKRIECPEWNSVLFSMPITVADRNELYRFGKGGSLEFLVRAIVMKAEDEAGKPVFTKDQVFDLMHYADAYVIERIANEILGKSEPEGGELGNSCGARAAD